MLALRKRIYKTFLFGTISSLTLTHTQQTYANIVQNTTVTFATHNLRVACLSSIRNWMVYIVKIFDLGFLLAPLVMWARNEIQYIADVFGIVFRSHHSLKRNCALNAMAFHSRECVILLYVTDCMVCAIHGESI